MHAPGAVSTSSALSILLSVAWYAVALVLAITVFLLLFGRNVALQIDVDGPSVDAGPAAAMSIPVSLNLDAGMGRVSAPSLGIESAQLGGLRGALRFPPRKGPLFNATLAIAIGWLALFLWVLGQLRGLFRNLRDRKPFAPANAARVRRVAWAVILGEVARSAVVFFENRYAMAHFSAVGFRFDARPHLDGVAIVNGLIILAIAEVFREGARLDEDRSLTI